MQEVGRGPDCPVSGGGDSVNGAPLTLTDKQEEDQLWGEADEGCVWNILG